MPKLDNYERDVDAQIGDRIRARRAELGMSQAELAEHIGMSFQQVQKYERGANRIASSILLRVAEALDCSPGYFLEISKKRRATKKAPPESAVDREVAAFIVRFRQIKSAKARARILSVVDALLRQFENAGSPAKAAPKKRAAAKSKPAPRAKASAKRTAKKP
ncbi:MAG: helix-turn-helix transcriptional regulator [Caulobacterales bacterium]